jgi:hypothetical protein
MSATPSSIDARSQRRGPARERDQRAVGRGAGRPARVREQHQREQTGDLAVAGQQPPQLARQPDRLAREVAALEVGARRRGVALVEDQVEHMEHDAQPLGTLGLGRELERHAGGLEPLLGAADALGHRRLGHQERVRDLQRGEAADGAQGERELRRRRQPGLAAEEQQPQRVVLAVAGVLARGGREQRVGGDLRRGGLLAAPLGPLRPHLVDQPARGHGDQPGARVLGHAVARPLRGGGDERLLHRVLGRVEAPVAPHERAEDLRREPAQQVLLGGRQLHTSSPPASMIGRTSIAANVAFGQRAAISVARSIDSQSTIR